MAPFGSVSLSCVQDSSVTQLTQDLAKRLGLKVRKAYVRTKVRTPAAHTVASAPSLTSCFRKRLGSNPVAAQKQACDLLTLSPSACPERAAKLKLSGCIL